MVPTHSTAVTAQLHALMLKVFPSGAFDKLTILLRDFSSAVSRIDETVTAVFEKIQGKWLKSLTTYYDIN